MSQYNFLDDMGVPKGVVRVGIKLLAWLIVLATMALILAIVIHMIILTVGQTMLEVQ